MTDGSTICHDLDLLDDWLAGKGYGEEAGLVLRALSLIHKLQDGVRSTIQERDVLSGENFDLRAENEKLRAALVAAMVREHQAYLICEDIVSSYDWAEDLEYTDMFGLMENMRHTVKGARDRAINDAQYELLNEHYVKNAGAGRWWEKIDLRAAAAALKETGEDIAS